MRVTSVVLIVSCCAILLVGTYGASVSSSIRRHHREPMAQTMFAEEAAEVEVQFSVDDMWNNIKQRIANRLDATMRAAKSAFESRVQSDSRYQNLPSAPTAASSSLAKCKIPSASAPVLSRAGALDIRHAISTNTLINSGYARLAECMQLIVNGNNGDTSAAALSRHTPVWFAIAPYASRVVGRSQLSADMAKTSLRTLASNLNSRIGVDPRPMYNYLTGSGSPSLSDDLLAVIGAMMVGFADSLDPLKDVNVIMHMMKKFVVAVTPDGCKGFSCCPLSGCIDAARFMVANVDKVPDFLIKYLMQGNIGIYGDIGASGELYLKWRDSYQQKSRTSIINVPKDAVLSEFCKKHIGARATDQDVEQCKSFYTFITTGRGGKGVDGTTTQADISRVANFNRDTYQKAMKTACFAAFEEAGKNPAQREDLIKKANNALAWVEQHYAVVPAFVDPSSRPRTDLTRKDLFHMTSPLVNLKLKTTKWSFYEYLRKPVSYPNWADFTTRWTPILDSFVRAAYPNKADLWAMPGAFAAKP